MPGRLLSSSVRKLDVCDYCLNGDRCMAAVCPAPGESQPRVSCQSWLAGQAERGNLLFVLFFSNMTDSFQKKIKHKGSLGSGKFHLTSKSPVLPPTGPLRPSDARRSAWLVNITSHRLGKI